MSPSESDTFIRESAAWQPVQARALSRLGEYLTNSGFLGSDQAWISVQNSALSILSRCVPFKNAPEVKTGLVVGYVQSGKTLSMSAVAAGAADNGCRLVIVLAGTKRNL